MVKRGLRDDWHPAEPYAAVADWVGMDIERDQQQFRNSRPSKMGRGIERLTHPFGKALSSVVPKSLVEAGPAAAQRGVINAAERTRRAQPPA